jgi:hypothetical protein
MKILNKEISMYFIFANNLIYIKVNLVRKELVSILYTIIILKGQLITSFFSLLYTQEMTSPSLWYMTTSVWTNCVFIAHKKLAGIVF